jgi:hypothetical protein
MTSFLVEILWGKINVCSLFGQKSVLGFKVTKVVTSIQEYLCTFFCYLFSLFLSFSSATIVLLVVVATLSTMFFNF